MPHHRIRQTAVCAGLAALTLSGLLPQVLWGDTPETPVFVRSIGTQGRLGTLNGPAGVAHVRTEGGSVVYVVDGGNARVQAVSSTRQVIGAFGHRGNYDKGGFWAPSDVAASPKGDIVYVVDRRHRVVMLFRPTPECLEGRASCFVDFFGGWGRGNGMFLDPVGLAVDGSGKVYVVDAGSHNVQVFDAWGSYLLTVGCFGVERGQLMHPMDAAIAADGTIWVADRDNDRLSVFQANGEFVTVHSFGDRLHYPVGIDFDVDGSFAVADYDTGYGQARLRIFSADRKLLREEGLGGDGRRDDYPLMGVALLPGHRVLCTVPTPYESGMVEVPFKGDPEWWFERGRALDQFSFPWAVAVDPLFLAVSDTGNDRVLIWEGPQGDRVQNVLGGELSPQFDFADPRGLAVWRHGPRFEDAVILVADPARNLVYRGTPNGRRLDAWGTGSPTEDLEGFRQPLDVAVALDGTTFIADSGNDRIVVRDPNGGVIGTIGPFENGPCEMVRPSAVTVGPDGLVYVLESGRSRLQAFTAAGEYVAQWVGSDERDVEPGRLWMPVDLTSDGDYLYVLENECIQQSDSAHVRVQVFSPVPNLPLEQTLVAVFGTEQGAGEGMQWNPRGVAATNGWVAIADSGNNRVQIYRWPDQGIMPPPLLPTNTPPPSATPTATSAPPSPTSTTAPSATPVRPTDTQVSATVAPTSTPTATDRPTQVSATTAAPASPSSTATYVPPSPSATDLPNVDPTAVPTDVGPRPSVSPTTQGTNRRPGDGRGVAYLPTLMR